MLCFSNVLLSTVFVNAAPDFIILGVTKCGTTSLYNYLMEHPHIARTKKKELFFFDSNFKKGIEWYNNKFALKEEGQLIGEATPGYFWKKGCLERIVQHCPKTKFIVLFRDPVKRVISEYLRRRRSGQESRRFGQAIFTHKIPYLEAGMYINHLERWLSFFPREQIHIVIAEDLFAKPEKEVNKVFKFLGLKEHRLASYPNHNKADNKLDVDPKTMNFLKKLYRPYNQLLRKFLGRSLPWR